MRIKKRTQKKTQRRDNVENEHLSVVNCKSNRK